MAKKSKAALESKNRALWKGQVADRITTIVTYLIRWGSLVLIVRYITGTISETTIGLAGKTTLADIGIRFVGDLKLSEAAAYIFGVGGVGYGWKQRNLRRDSLQHLHPRAQKYEESIDPARSSSRLTPRGDTRPEDDP
jgi:hypothetical protein